jgi:hypothetical protein
MHVSRFVLVLIALASWPAAAQQRADLDFQYEIAAPAYPSGEGPRLAIDAGHHNFHTADGRYAPFAKLAAADGFQVTALDKTLDADALADVDILVIANALNAANDGRWVLPTPSAFTEDEVKAVRDWVDQGGSLLLIADHMPFPGAAAELAAAFGFLFTNGYAANFADRSMNFTFLPGSGLDLSALDTEGLPEINRVVTFTGQAFSAPSVAHSLLTLDGKYAAFMPTAAGRFDRSTPVVDVSGYSQGAVVDFGEGRIAVFGEAGAFTAQVAGNGQRMGMNAPGAEGNAPFVLAVLRWLAGDKS